MEEDVRRGEEECVFGKEQAIGNQFPTEADDVLSFRLLSPAAVLTPGIFSNIFIPRELQAADMPQHAPLENSSL